MPGNSYAISALTQRAGRGEWAIDKPGKGMFYATGRRERLQARGISHLLFAGVTTEVCGQTSLREVNERGYRCLLIEEATQSYFQSSNPRHWR